jgi:hypothetical protein
MLDEEGPFDFPSAGGTPPMMIMAPRAGRWVSAQRTVPVKEPVGNDGFAAGF